VAVLIAALLDPAADPAAEASAVGATVDESGDGGEVRGVVSMGAPVAVWGLVPAVAVSCDEVTATSAGETGTEAVEVGGESIVLATTSSPPALGAVTRTSA
jgi:hypothetical protein